MHRYVQVTAWAVAVAVALAAAFLLINRENLGSISISAIHFDPSRLFAKNVPQKTYSYSATSTLGASSTDLFTSIENPRGYIHDGSVPSGAYAGFDVLVVTDTDKDACIGDYPCVEYNVLLTQDYKTFYLDADFNKSRLSLSGQRYLLRSDEGSFKIVDTVQNIPLPAPESISIGQFVLKREGIFGTQILPANATPLNGSSEVNGLQLFGISKPALDISRYGDSSQLVDFANAANKYVVSDSTILARSPAGVLYSYELISKEQWSRSSTLGRESSEFYNSSDFSTRPPLYSSYDSEGFLPYGCAIHFYAPVLQKISPSDLIEVTKTAAGVPLYSLKDVNADLNQLEFRAKITSQPNLFDPSSYNPNPPTEPTYTDYVAKNPLIFFQDPWDRWIAIGESQYEHVGGCGKPVIYLYPPTPTKVSVSFVKPIRFKEDIPTVLNNQWNVLAYPDGTLVDLQPGATVCDAINSKIFGLEYAHEACEAGKYPYLFWAGSTSGDYPSANTGWVVSRADLSALLDAKLSEIGFTEKEKKDMISYWVPELMEKNAPYYRITLFQTSDLNTFLPMKVSPKPDTVIRTFLDWSPLEASISITPEVLTHIDRSGFTYAEWGGLKQ